MPLRRKDSGEVLAVVKLYGFVPDESRLESIWALVAEQLAALPASSYDYSVNYGKSRKYDAMQLARTMKQFDDIEQLLITSADGTCGAAATALLALQLPQRLYEFCFFTRTTDPVSRFVDMATRALRGVKVIYGYGRALRADATPLSEAVPKRTLLGKTFEVDPHVHVWKCDLTLDDGVKGIYPFNIWSTRILKEPMLAPVVANLQPESIVPLGSTFAGVILRPEELAQVRGSSADLRDFVRP